jgi:hypothetical protein
METGRYSEAYELLAPLYQDQDRWSELPYLLSFHILNGLALMYKQREEPAQALALHEDIDSLLRRVDAPGSLRSVSNQANLGLLHYNLGN